MENSNRSVEESSPAPAKPGVLKNPITRRNRLFGLTLLTLVLVFVGAVPLGEVMMTNPPLFFCYWITCFILAVVVLGLAFYDFTRVRREHARRVRDLEKELAATAEEVRRLIREMRENEE